MNDQETFDCNAIKHNYEELKKNYDKLYLIALRAKDWHNELKGKHSPEQWVVDFKKEFNV